MALMGSKMPRKSPTKVATASQHQRFAEAARELECDDDKERFEERLKKVAKAKLKSSESKK
jgi:hypothetical protein